MASTEQLDLTEIIEVCKILMISLVCKITCHRTTRMFVFNNASDSLVGTEGVI